MKLSMLLVGIMGAALLVGCGRGADENKTPEQIKQEVAAMNADDIKAMAVKYEKAIDKKVVELKNEMDKLAKIPLTEQLGAEAKKVQGNISELKSSIDKLKKNLDAYLAGLTVK